MRPQLLALRAANQYRTRDIMAYLGLRYYFANQCARRDRWAEEVASHLVLTRSKPAYIKSLHFKDIRDDGTVDHRDVFLPGPNEAYAEAALLAECAKHPEFKPLPCVFSYQLADGNENRGVYAPYFSGFRDRHDAIAAACRADKNAVVLYTDIKKFYPCIPAGRALSAWNRACDEAGMPDTFFRLGQKLLADHADVANRNNHSKGLLTGPMFSHLIANLVLRDVDKEMSSAFPDRYFRYVDDVVLVGGQDEVAKGRADLAKMLGELGLQLHAPNQGKDFEVDAKEWLEGAGDFDNDDGKGWMYFVAAIKRFVISQPTERQFLADKLARGGFRIPMQNYILATRESPFLLRFKDFLRRYKWSLKSLKRITIFDIWGSAKALQQDYTEQLDRLLTLDAEIQGYKRKRTIPKIRYFAGRLLYLAPSEDLIRFSDAIRAYPELHMLAEVMLAVATRDVTALLPLGSNAAQSAAQLLRLQQTPITCRIEKWDEASIQGLAILRINGIAVDGPADDALNQFSLWKDVGRKLMESDDPFIQELACLHGVSAGPRHEGLLNTAFDRDEELAFDVINQMRQSDYL